MDPTWNGDVNMGSFADAAYLAKFNDFKLQCKVCDIIEESDSDGYNIDDFDNVWAYCTFNYEGKVNETLKEYFFANKNRCLKD